MAAGDAFNGALAVALAEGMELERAVLLACAAGALAVTTTGAQDSMPTRAAVREFMASGHSGLTQPVTIRRIFLAGGPSQQSAPRHAELGSPRQLPPPRKPTSRQLRRYSSAIPRHRH